MQVTLWYTGLSRWSYSRNSLPKAPHTSGVALRAVHRAFVNMYFSKLYWALPHHPHCWGPQKAACIRVPSWPNWPTLMLFLQSKTRETMDIAFATGPVVMDIKGIAVYANHQTWGSLLLASLKWKWLCNRSPQSGACRHFWKTRGFEQHGSDLRLFRGFNPWKVLYHRKALILITTHCRERFETILSLKKSKDKRPRLFGIRQSISGQLPSMSSSTGQTGG